MNSDHYSRVTLTLPAPRPEDVAPWPCRPQHLPAGGAAAGARSPRLRGVRRAAGDRDPARRLPAGHDAARRARPGRAARGLPGDAARGDGRAAPGRPGRDHPRPRRRHRGHAQAGHPVGRGPPRGSPPPSARTGWTRSTFRRIVEPGAAAARRAARSSTTYAASSSSRRTPRWPRPQARRAPAGGLPLPPDHRRRSPTPRAPIEAVTSVQATLHEMLLAIPVLEHQHRPLRPPAHPAGQRDPGRQARPGPPGHGGALRRHGGAAARPRGLSRDGRQGDR